MIRILLTFSLMLCITSASLAQCPGCVINSSYTSPGIYPNILPDGTQNQPYNEDVTFVMFTDTMGFAVNYFKITSISGLPLGLNAECSNISNGCTYNPQTSIYGCVKVCGTPVQTGNFTVAVNVIANLQVVGNQNSTINIPLTIYPASGGNSGFSFSPASACGSAQVAFQGLLNNPAYINSYNWNFGNGNTSNVQNPPVQNYDTAGIYYVTLQTQYSVYALSSLTVSSVNNNWCGDVEEPNIFGCTGAPDLFVVITNAGGNVVYQSPTVNNVNSATWNNINIPLNNPPYSFTIWDEDVISQNDNLGTFSFNPTNTGTFNYSGAGGTSGNYTISTQVVTSFNSLDSIVIYPFPSEPIISVLGNDTICSGDSVTLKAWSADAAAYNWYAADVAIAGATDSLLQVNASGIFKVEAVNSFGCSSFSSNQIITQQPPLPNVNFTINGNTLTTFLSSYNLQWLLNGNEINGATNTTHTISQQGTYSLRACDDFGCCRLSEAYLLTPVSVYTIADVNISVYPNPAQHQLNIAISDNVSSLYIDLMDMTGRIFFAETISGSQTLDVSQLPSGNYILRAVHQNGILNQRIVIQH